MSALASSSCRGVSAQLLSDRTPVLAVIRLHRTHQKCIWRRIQRDSQPHDDLCRWNGDAALNVREVLVTEIGHFLHLSLTEVQRAAAARDALPNFMIV